MIQRGNREMGKRKQKEQRKEELKGRSYNGDSVICFSMMAQSA